MDAVWVLFLQKDGVISSGAWSVWRSDQESGPPLVFSFETALLRARGGMPGFVAVGQPPSFPPQAMPTVDGCLQPRTRTQDKEFSTGDQSPRSSKASGASGGGQPLPPRRWRGRQVHPFPGQGCCGLLPERRPQSHTALPELLTLVLTH